MSAYDFSDVYQNAASMQEQNNPVLRFAQGFQIGSVMRQQQAAAQQKEQEAIKQKQINERAALLQSEMVNFGQLNDPYQRVEFLNNLSVKFPEMADKFNSQSKFYSDEVKTNAMNTLLPAFNALNLGNKDVAIARLTTAAEAFKNSGNTKGADSINAYIEDIKTTDNIAPLVQTGYLSLASILGPDKLTEVLSKSQDYAQNQAIMPSEIDKAKFEATIKGEEAKRAPIETQIKGFEAQTKGAEAEFARQNEQLDIANKQANLALTNQQKMVAIANANKINKEIADMAKNVANGAINIADPKDRFNFEQKLRDEYKSNTTEFVKTRDAYDRMQSIYDSYVKPDKDGKVTLPQGETKEQALARQAAGDIGLIFNYMKMLDPGSTVREGEFATAANAAGVPDRIANLYNKIASGERLTPAQRYSYYKQAEGLYNKSKSRADEVKSSLSKVVDSYGLNKENVFASPKGTVKKVK